MIEQLSNLDTMMLRCYYIYKTVGKEDAQESIDNVKRQAIYSARQYRHNVDATKIKITDKEVEQLIWKRFIIDEIKAGKTTLDIANEHALSLERVNSYMT